MRIRRLAAVAVAATGVLSLTACSAHHTDPSMVNLRYAGGVSEGGAFKECVKPGKKEYSNDSYYPYPTSQRQDVWDSDNPDADHKDMQVNDKDGNVAYVKMTIAFYLNTDCQTLRSYHEKIGRTRHAYFNDDGTYPKGWITAMNYYISTPVVQLTQGDTQDYAVENMWLKAGTRSDIAKAIQDKLQDAVNNQTEGDKQYYQDMTVNISSIQPSTDFQKLYSDRKTAQIKADTAEANKKAQIAEAQANTAVEKEKANVLRAQISGYPSVQAYLQAQAIEKGMNPFQPSGTLISGGAQ